MKGEIDIQGGEFHPFNSQKILCHGYRMEAIVNRFYMAPIVMNLDVTGDCQYHCNHCHHRRKQVQNKRMPPLSKELADTLPYFLKHWDVRGTKVLACCIVGSQGDALLYPGLPKLLKELHFAGIEVGLVTNGYGFTEELINYAVHYTKFIGFSMDAACAETYKKIKNCPEDAWPTVIGSIHALTYILKKRRLRNDVGWKMLILPESQNEIYEACATAKARGCRYVQIRPADLPEKERQLIDVEKVEHQIQKAIADFEKPGEFEIVGVRHKFNPDYSKVLPKYCYLTPLTVTVTSDGRAYACVDRRCDQGTELADVGCRGWSALRDVWGSSEHMLIVDRINNFGQGPDCNIRCSNYGYDKFFTNFYVDDNVDRNLI